MLNNDFDTIFSNDSRDNQRLIGDFFTIFANLKIKFHKIPWEFHMRIHCIPRFYMVCAFDELLVF